MKGSARSQAATSLDRILRTGAYSNVLVRATAVTPLSDHRFYQRLVFTALRHIPFIDDVLSRASNRPLDRLDPLVLSVLRSATAEFVFLGTQPHAVVHEAVETTRSLGKARASGFVNAVMRSVVDARPNPTGAATESYPADVIDAVIDALGADDAEAFLEHSNEAAPVGIRMRSEHASQARYLAPGEDVARDIAANRIDVIDPASAAVVAALDPKPGDRVLDMAAAPGGKTRAIADAVGRGRVVGMDAHRRRLRDAAARSADIPTIVWLAGDGQHPPFADGSFDRVLVDAPCSGLGTMRRRPEVRYRFRSASEASYQALQRSMVEAAMRLVRPGGVVIYSACTVTHAETVEVVEDRGFQPPVGVGGTVRGAGTLLAPHTDGTDGMFIARWQAPDA